MSAPPVLCPGPHFDCPHCGAPRCWSGQTVDAAGAPAPLAEGSVSVCEDCRLPGVFVSTPLGVLELRTPTPREAAEIAVDPDYRQALAQIDRDRAAPRLRQDPGRGGLWVPS